MNEDITVTRPHVHVQPTIVGAYGRPKEGYGNLNDDEKVNGTAATAEESISSPERLYSVYLAVAGQPTSKHRDKAKATVSL